MVVLVVVVVVEVVEVFGSTTGLKAPPVVMNVVLDARNFLVGG